MRLFRRFFDKVHPQPWAPPSLKPDAVARALTRKDPVRIVTNGGISDDRIDRMKLVKDGQGDPASISTMHEDAKTDPQVAKMIETYKLWKTPREQIESYYELGVGQAVADLMSRFGIGPAQSIADVGCGLGWLAYSLDRIGFRNLTAMDPSASALEKLRNLAGDRIDIISDLDEWRAIRNRFDAIITVATIHHWEHIPWISLEARRTMKPGAYWFAVMEWFADTPAEFFQAMDTHPTRERYNQYEWAYPASAYVDLIQSVGFTLCAVVPQHYRDSALLTISSAIKRPGKIDVEKLNAFVDANLTGLNGTVELFWEEVDARLRRGGSKLFSRPQVLVFQRTTAGD